MQPRGKGAGTEPLSFRMLEAGGGWVIEVRVGENTDVALFRSESAKTATLGDPKHDWYRSAA